MTSHIFTFIFGVAIGVFGKYFADKYTDKRRKKEVLSDSKKLFISVASQMPDLIKEMNADLINPDLSFIREFFILPNDRIGFNADREPYLYYFEEQHPSLISKVKLLQNNGFVYDITHTNAPKYRMTEEFAMLVKKVKVKKNRIKIT